MTTESKATEPCPFCTRIAAGDFTYTRDGCVVFEPLNPVTPGHLLVVPIDHAPDATQDPNFGRASALAAFLIFANHLEANIITSVGPAATQSISHTHVHIVPRRKGDGLHLPWTGQLPLDPCDYWLDGHSHRRCRQPRGHEGEHSE